MSKVGLWVTYKSITSYSHRTSKSDSFCLSYQINSRSAFSIPKDYSFKSTTGIQSMWTGLCFHWFMDSEIYYKMLRSRVSQEFWVLTWSDVRLVGDGCLASSLAPKHRCEISISSCTKFLWSSEHFAGSKSLLLHLISFTELTVSKMFYEWWSRFKMWKSLFLWLCNQRC